MVALKYLIPCLLLFLAVACDDEADMVPMPPEEPEVTAYFPPGDPALPWDTVDPVDLGWSNTELDGLYDYLADNGTRAFLIVHKGKIVVERYWGSNILGTAPFDRNAIWYWASAGKSLSALLVGIAQQEGLLNIEDKSSDYLGAGWTSLPAEKEDLITIRHQLTMSTGLDYRVDNLDCTAPACLQYRQDAGTQWFYHNAPYTLLRDVVANASGISYNAFTDGRVEQAVGMRGEWIQNGDNNVYWSVPRDMARFGLLVLNEGRWNGQAILEDQNYLQEMIEPSQDLNPSYGYLWWLNGAASIIAPGLPNSFNRQFAPSAPADLKTGAGKNGQYVNVVPSRDLVVVRMGEAPDSALVPINFHDEIWARLERVIN